MDAVTFRVRGDQRKQVKQAIAALRLPRNERDGYTYDDAQLLIKQIERILDAQHY